MTLGCGGMEGESPTGQPGNLDGECREATCTSGLRITLASSGVFSAGRYSVTTFAEGVEVVCGFEVGGDAEVCGPDVPCLLGDDCDADFNLLAPPHSATVRVEPGTPERVDIVVSREGAVVASAEFAPRYDEFAPAGIDCEPVCLVGSAQLDIP